MLQALGASLQEKEEEDVLSKELLQRVEAIKARNRVIESVPGSGFHDSDVDFRGCPRCPQKKPNPLRTGSFLPRLSEHVVRILDVRLIHFVGSDAEKVLAALQTWHARTSSREPNDLDGTERNLMRTIPGYSLTQVDGVTRLSLWRDEWNDLLHALACESIGLSGIPMVSDGTTP